MQGQKKTTDGNKEQMHNMLYSKQFIFIFTTNSPNIYVGKERPWALEEGQGQLS